MTTRIVALLLVVALTAGVVVVGQRAYRRFVGGLDYVRRDANPPATVARFPVDGPLAVVGADTADGRPVVVTEPMITLAVDPPAGAEALQIGFDPSFTFDEWQPVGVRAVLPVTDQGYQIVYARFRTEDGSMTETVSTGVEVDLDRPAAVVGAGGARHRPVWARPLSARELVVRVEAGRVDRGSLELLDLDDLPDRFSTGLGLIGPRQVSKDGRPYGWLVSDRTDVVRRLDQLQGRPFDAEAAAGRPWTVSSADDPAYGLDGVEVVVSRRFNRPMGGVLDDRDRSLWVGVHDLVLDLPSPLVDEAVYVVAGPEDLVEPVELNLDRAVTVSPAVQVNQVGYQPGDGAKIGFLGGWPGASDPDPSDSTPSFRVVDVVDGSVALRGTGTRRVVEDETGRGDLTGPSVYGLDFSEVTNEGRYRLCVDGVGCSYDFDIGPAPWHDLSVSVAKSVYLQRSGAELGPPHVPFVRPRPYHPDDGAVVQATTMTLLDTNTSGDGGFDGVVAGGTGIEVPEAWGGHFDAGDWDRRIQHLWFARVASQLVTAYPERYLGLELNIPESGDEVPDLLDEALWSLDFYRRLQTVDGAIRGGVEASQHPPPNSTSWTDDLAVYALDPDPWSSYLFAGIAAEVSVALAPHDGMRAEEYLASAGRAIEWADAQDWESSDRWDDGQRAAVAGQRNVAAAAMLYASGDPGWHDRFVATADYLEEVNDLMSCHVHTMCDAAWLYLQSDPSVTDPGHRALLEESFIRSADAILAATDGTAYGFTTEHPEVPLVWGLGSGGAPHGSGLAKAYQLTGDERYRNGLLRSASVALGANPTNSVLVTGHGQEPARHPLVVDAINGGLPVWPGIPVYGRHRLNSAADDNWVVDQILGPAGAEPSPLDVPYMWQWYDVMNVAFFNEFTVHQSHTEALLTYGTLAATG